MKNYVRSISSLSVSSRVNIPDRGAYTRSLFCFCLLTHYKTADYYLFENQNGRSSVAIHKEYGTFVAECDGCGSILDTEMREFYLVPETLKQSGWQISKPRDGEWTHKCPHCVLASFNSQSDFEV